MAATLGLGATAAWAQQPSQADLQKQVEQLQSQVKDLQTQRATPAYNAKDVDATVDSVLSDANRRSQLLAESGGFSGGWMNDHFTIRSADGNYTMMPGIQFQFRTVTTYNDKVQASGDANTDNGFDMRRLKLRFEGNAITKDLQYFFEWATDHNNGSLVNEQGYIQYQFADNFSVKVGQYKEYIYHEQSVSSRTGIAADRSLLNEVFFLGESFVQGVDLIYDNQQNLRADIAFTDGFASRNSNFQDPPTNTFDFGVHARVEWQAIGTKFKGYSQFTSLGNKQDLLVFGAGGDWSQADSTNQFRYAADAQWNSGPWGAYIAAVGVYTDPAGGTSSMDCGLLIQANYLINSQWEIFGRYDYMHLDSNSTASHGSENTFHEITVGLNYYLHGHAAKITVDAGWLPNGAPSNQTGIGVLANDGENEYYIRGQFQLLL